MSDLVIEIIVSVRSVTGNTTLNSASIEGRHCLFELVGLHFDTTQVPAKSI